MNIRIESIKVMNIFGEEILSTENNTDINNINLSPFPSGIYFIIIDTNQGRGLKKILLAK